MRRRSVFFVLSALCACNAVLGIEDPTVEPDEDAGHADATTDGAAESAADSPTDRASETAVDATVDGGSDAPADAGLDGADAGRDAAPTVLAIHQPFPKAIAVDGVNVYWLDAPSGDAGTIEKCAILGCGQAPTSASSANEPQSLALSGAGVYWADSNGAVLSVLKSDMSDAGAIIGGLGAPVSLAFSGTYLYWAEASGRIARCTPSTCTPTACLNSGIFAAPSSVVAASNTPYWVSDRSDGSVSGSIGCGGAFYDVATREGAIVSLAIDTKDLYWTASSPAHVSGYTWDAASTDVLADGGAPRGIAVDAKTVYFTDTAGGTIMTVPRALDAGAATVFADNLQVPWGIAVDDKYVYVTEAIADGSVLRYSK